MTAAFCSSRPLPTTGNKPNWPCNPPAAATGHSPSVCRPAAPSATRWSPSITNQSASRSVLLQRLDDIGADGQTYADLISPEGSLPAFRRQPASRLSQSVSPVKPPALSTSTKLHLRQPAHHGLRDSHPRSERRPIGPISIVRLYPRRHLGHGHRQRDRLRQPSAHIGRGQHQPQRAAHPHRSGVCERQRAKALQGRISVDLSSRSVGTPAKPYGRTRPYKTLPGTSRQTEPDGFANIDKRRTRPESATTTGCTLPHRLRRTAWRDCVWQTHRPTATAAIPTTSAANGGRHNGDDTATLRVRMPYGAMNGTHWEKPPYPSGVDCIS